MVAVEPIEAPIHSAAEVEAVMAKLGREAGAGLIVMSDTSTVVYREAMHFGFYYFPLWMVHRSLIDFFNSIGH
jgi:hypothetical protein